MTSPVHWACLFLKEGPCCAGMRWRSGARQRQTCLRRRWRNTAKTSMISGKTLWVCTECRGGGRIDCDSFSNDSNTIFQKFGVRMRFLCVPWLHLFMEACLTISQFWLFIAIANLRLPNLSFLRIAQYKLAIRFFFLWIVRDKLAIASYKVRRKGLI